MSINTDMLSSRYRQRAIDLVGKRLLVTNFQGTEQEKDLSEPSNCSGFGRVRHFRRVTSAGWPANPLPIDPACKHLGLPRVDVFRVQAFQNAVCNWRCWYCFVPFDLLSGNRQHSDLLSASQLVDCYLDQPDPPLMIDLTGGQPDLVPEWVAWTMVELRQRKLENKVYLWSDDNLSNDYFWQYLSERERELIATYEHYGRVCCFKGFNEESFAFNTLAEHSLYRRQFDLMDRLLTSGIDLYAYVTITTPTAVGIEDDMRRFIDRLQELDPNLPLRTVPLEIEVFTPVGARLDDVKKQALVNQWRAVEAWQKELESRYSSEERMQNIAEVPLQGQKARA